MCCFLCFTFRGTSLGCDGTGTRLNVADILRTSEGPSSPRSNKNKSKKEGGKAIPPQKTNKRLTKWDLLSRRGAKKPREKVKDVVLRGHTVKTKEDTRNCLCGSHADTRFCFQRHLSTFLSSRSPTFTRSRPLCSGRVTGTSRHIRSWVV